MTIPALAACRAEIDAIDQKLVAILAERFAVVERVIAIKQQAGIPATIPARVDEVIGNAEAQARQRGLPPRAIEQVWKVLVDVTCAYEEQKLASVRHETAAAS